ncbi:hypothetical protein [Paracoccus sp. (in: a-proteobacteria)]|uniref:hypothetical protein n=1 Tax=Paracoccus sp. TaxID=267 RepID=UPI0028ADA175|nr:hypothetical protein [Paracoccus sp. (in: a-proteobacteria)]
MTEKILIAVDPDALAGLCSKIDSLLTEIRNIRMSPMPEWITAHEYAESVGRTTRTVSNWVKTGKIESKRHGRTLLIRAYPR